MAGAARPEQPGTIDTGAGVWAPGEHPPTEEVVDVPAAETVEQEVVEEDMENSYLEPTVCLTEPEEVSSGLASVDPATVTTNTPALALATVMPDTPVLGGRVTPHPLHQLIPVHPSLFIRTTCSKIMLPPGLYSY